MSTYISFFDEKLCMGQIKFHASQIRASILILLWAKDCFGNLQKICDVRKSNCQQTIWQWKWARIKVLNDNQNWELAFKFRPRCRRRQIRQNLDCLACGMRGNFGSRATCRKCKKMNPARRQEGVKIDLTKAKTDYVLRQNHEAKQKAVLRECKKQQKAAEKRRANQHRQVFIFQSSV